MSRPVYPAAQAVAATVEEHFIHHTNAANKKGAEHIAPPPDANAVEVIVDSAFWASLRREEAYSPKVSIAFLSPTQSAQPLMFAHSLPLTPSVLTKLAAAVERPVIHLG